MANVTLTTHGSTEALDGILRRCKKHLIVFPMCPRGLRHCGQTFFALQRFAQSTLFDSGQW